MAQQELETALRREGELEALKIWRKAEAEAAQLRQDAERLLDSQRQSAASRCEQETCALQEAEAAEARKQAQSCRLTTEDSMARRLRTLAEGLLKDLALSGGINLFQQLAKEIPDYQWQRVKVNPRDATKARAAFEAAAILTDEGITGGLEVESVDGQIRIINSLEKRLEHLWPELLPDLFKELRPIAGDDESIR